MNYTIRIQPRARKELLEAWVWYEEKQFGLGDQFEIEVYKRIEQISEHPEKYPKRIHFFRETRVKTFPYLIIYKIEEDSKMILVSSIFHTGRNPKLKYK